MYVVYAPLLNHGLVSLQSGCVQRLPLPVVGPEVCGSLLAKGDLPPPLLEVISCKMRSPGDVVNRFALVLGDGAHGTRTDLSLPGKDRSAKAWGRGVGPWCWQVVRGESAVLFPAGGGC